MATYKAPVDDMMFLFEKLRDNSHYNSLEKYKEVNSDLAKDILEQAAKLTENLILPLAYREVKVRSPLVDVSIRYYSRDKR